jgi:YHS domain-containing protein
MKSKVIVFGSAFFLLNIGYSLAQESTKAKFFETTTQEEGTGDKKYCLICGPEEETEALSVSYKYKGKKYSFCSMDCLKAFKENPEQFIKADEHDKEDTDHKD